jgi:hypothetical protein
MSRLTALTTRIGVWLWAATSLVQAQETRTVAGHEELSGPAVWVYQDLMFENGSSLRTNGHPLTITVLGRQSCA